MFRIATWASSTSSPSSWTMRFLSSSSCAIGGETGVGGLSGMHPIARFVASIAEVGPVEIVASIELMSLRSDMKMRTKPISAECSGKQRIDQTHV